MGIQKVISQPSQASQRRGRVGMPSVQRRVHYQAAEEGRESVQVVDSAGQELGKAEAIERLGGADAPYVEVVSDVSSLEMQALMERQPEREPKEVALDFFTAQARELEKKYYDGEERIIVNAHGEPDGTFHAHYLLPGTEESLREALAGERQRDLGGRHGQAQAAFDKAWSSGMDLGLDRTQYAALMAEQRAYREQVSALRKQANALEKETAERLKATANADGKGRLDIQREAGEKQRALVDKIHALEVERIGKFWEGAGRSGSLEHLVYLEREEFRHRGDSRRADARIAGVNVSLARQTNAGDREAFRHMNARQRAKVREEGLARELSAVRIKHEIQVRDLDRNSSDYSERVARQEHEIRGILLRHEAAKLGDQERDLARVGGAASRFATHGMRARLMEKRHGFERQALQASAMGRGKAEAAPEATAKLDARQARERDSLRSEPIKAGASKIQGKAVAVGRRMANAPAKVVGKALDKLKKLEKSVSKGRRQAGSKELGAAKDVAKGAATSIGKGVVKVAVTLAIESGKAALHQAKHVGEAIATTAKAIAAGSVNPAAGAKIAAEGYGKTAVDSMKTVAADLKTGGKKVAKDTATATRETAGQTVAGLTQMGMAAAPGEAQAAIKTTKEALLAAARATRQVVQGAITLSPLKAATGASKELAAGALKTGKAAASGLATAKLPAPVDKTLGILAKVPVVGILPGAVKTGAELANGLAKGPGLDMGL